MFLSRIISLSRWKVILYFLVTLISQISVVPFSFFTLSDGWRGSFSYRASFASVRSWICRGNVGKDLSKALVVLNANCRLLNVLPELLYPLKWAGDTSCLDIFIG